MLLDKQRTEQLLKNNGYTKCRLAKDLGMNEQKLESVLNGNEPANRRQAESLINIFGILEICWAMKDNWRWMPYAIHSAFGN